MSSACDSCPSKSGCTSQDSCPSRNKKINENIKTVIGIASGKGGVGKSFVTTALAAKLARQGLKVGIMDADVTGPSIPKAFGLKGMLTATEENRMIPAVTKSGVKVVSLNLLLKDEEAPVIWRGPVISGVIQQFWTEVDWGMLDVLLIDMPPGTGDVPLTVFQSIPLDGIVLVSTPQDLVSMIVNKAKNMAQMMNVNIIGLVENMSYIKCPHCDETISLFGDDKALAEAADKAGITILDRLPLDTSATAKVDGGDADSIGDGILDNTVKIITEIRK